MKKSCLNQIIKKIYERDHSRCVLCGLSSKEHLKKYGDKLIIHQKDLNRNHNTVDNQELLCLTCYNKVLRQLRRLKFKKDVAITLHKEVFLRCAHQLRDGYPFSCKFVHGEYYRVRLWVKGHTLDKYGILVDFKYIKKLLDDKYDHRFINEIPPFDKINPTVEDIAKYWFFEINEHFNKLINKPKLIRIQVYESDSSYCEVGEDKNEE